MSWTIMSNGSIPSDIYGLLKGTAVTGVLYSTSQALHVSEAQGYAMRQQSSGLFDAGLRYHLPLYPLILMPVGRSFRSRERT